MELIDTDKPKLLTNIEVSNLIKEKLESKKKVRSQQTLLYTSSKYLNNRSPCTHQSEESVSLFLKEIKHFKLTKSETVMLINHCPSTQVELSVMISDMDSRLSSTKIDELIKTIETHFPEGVIASQNINSAGTLDETSAN